MAVLIEAISVVIRLVTIESRYPGGWAAFVADAPNQTLCADENLARFGFMQPSDMERFVAHLKQYGIEYIKDGIAQDLVVVDQQRGPLASCPWIEFGHVSIGSAESHPVAAARISGDTLNKVITPDGWDFNGSLSQTFGFVPAGHENKSLRFLRHEDGIDVYFNEMTGKEVYVGRTRP